MIRLDIKLVYRSTAERFNINTPAIGHLYNHMFLSNNGEISKEFGYRTMMTDILVVIRSKEIMKAKTKLDILKNILTIHPFIEIPTLRFKEEGKWQYTGATNMLATCMVMAEGIEVEPTEKGVNKLANIKTVFLDKDNNIIKQLALVI